jgi:hypothetical protein
MADVSLSPATMVSAIIKQIEAEAVRLREETIMAAVAKFEMDLRDTIAISAVRATEHYDIANNDGRLIITVLHGGTDGRR